MRISEFCGLTLSDVDMKNKKIMIDKQLQRMRDGTYVIMDTKTMYGERCLPMLEDDYQCFKRMIVKRKKPRVEPVVDCKKGFVVFDKNGMTYLTNHWEKCFQNALGKCNRTYKKELPKV